MKSRDETLATWNAEMDRRTAEIEALLERARSAKAKAEGLDDSWSVALQEKRDHALERLRRLRESPEDAWHERHDAFQTSRRELKSALLRAQAAWAAAAERAERR